MSNIEGVAEILIEDTKELIFKPRKGFVSEIVNFYERRKNQLETQNCIMKEDGFLRREFDKKLLFRDLLKRNCKIAFFEEYIIYQN